MFEHLLIFLTCNLSTLVLGAGIVSKGTLFFMVAQMKPIVSNVNGTGETSALGKGPRPLPYCTASGGQFVGFTEKASVAWHL